MSTTAVDRLTDPTELGPARKPGPNSTATRSVEERIQSLLKFGNADVLAVARRVQRSHNPLHAATNVSVREILALTEMLVRVDDAARRKLLGEQE